jgi:translocation and assembly module TamA
VPRDERKRVDTPASIGFEAGEPARSGVINQASALSIEQWRRLARAKAREAEREVTADHRTDRLDVGLTIEPGREARYGPMRVEGSRRTYPDFIAFMADLPEGKRYDSADIAAGQARLARLNIFRSIRIEEAEEIAPDGSLPLTVRVEDRRPRTIGFGATLSTLDGIGVTAYWLHRNLFGRAESLRFDAGVDALGSSLNPNNYDYNFGVTFTKPGVWTPDTSFVTSLVAQRVDYDTYREKSVTARAGLSQTFSDRLNGDVFAEISRARFEDDFGVRWFTIFSLPAHAQYDRRNDPLDASSGYYLAAELEPFYEGEFGNPGLRGTLEGRTYFGFGAEDRMVLAGRAKVGSYWGPGIAESPPDLLFFAGGGGSVRGYAYQSIGVESFDCGDDEPCVVGGKGLLEGSGELRYRINERFGAVGFLDAGLVTSDPKLGGDTDLRFGVGLGVRYFTAIGPLRFDLATPIDRRPEDSLVALYIGIGQAF